MMMASTDGGATFGPARELATAGASSDHPALIETSHGLFLSWYAADTGHRLIPVDMPAPGLDLPQAETPTSH
jgi:hypothetical protein